VLTTRLSDGWVESEVKGVTAKKEKAGLNRHKFHALFRDQPVAILAVIHRTTGF
jgi:hypothetical protein